MFGYSFPCAFEKPFDHQVTMFRFHLENPNSFNLSTMGTGKTLASLWVSDFLMQHKKISKVLIIAPLSIIDSVWAKNIFEHFLHRKSAVLHGSKTQRLKMLEKEVDFYIINHDGIKIIEKEIKAKKFDLCIVDEMTAYKNYNSDRSKSAQRIARSCRAVIGMTGSPVSDNPVDSFGQAKLVRPDNPNLPEYFGQFRNRICTQFDEFTWIPKIGWEDEVNKILNPAIRFELRDCVDLPPEVYEDRVVAMTEEQKKAFKEMDKDNITTAKNQTISAVNAGARAMKLLQIAGGVLMDTGTGTYVPLNCSPKLNEMDNAHKQYGCRPTIVCAKFKPVIAELAKFTRKKYPDSITEVVTGDTSRKQRADIFDRFDKGLVEWLIIQPKVAAHGLDLTTSNLVIWFTPHDSGEVYEQTNARVSRPGQTRTQFIVRLSTSKSEARVYNALHNKENMSQLFINLVNNPLRI